MNIENTLIFFIKIFQIERLPEMKKIGYKILLVLTTVGFVMSIYTLPPAFVFICFMFWAVFLVQYLFAVHSPFITID